MVDQRKPSHFGTMIVLALLLSATYACTPAGSRPKPPITEMPPGNDLSATPSPCPTFFCGSESGSTGTLSDCDWSGTVFAWVDQNKNGLWDEDERPLSGVAFYASDQYHAMPAMRMVTEVTSNEQGQAVMKVLIAGCPADEALVINAEPPPGYEGTTELQSKVRDTNDRGPFHFGFARGAIP